jgi:hypothetical protein
LTPQATPPAIQIVQSGASPFSSSDPWPTDIQVTLSVVTAGNAILVVTPAVINTTGSPTLTITDSVNSVTDLEQLASFGLSSVYSILDFSIIPNASAGAHTLTATVGSGTGYGFIVAAEISGLSSFVEGLHPMRRMADLGVHAPLYAGAASKVLLAGMEDGEIEMYLKRTDFTAFQKTTITDSAMLWREVNAIRKRGFAESKGELFLGGGALAAPIKDFFGATVAVMDILTPEHRYTAAHRNHCIDMLLDGSRRASERLGYRAEPPEPPAAPLRSTPRKRAPQLGS